MKCEQWLREIGFLPPNDRASNVSNVQQNSKLHNKVNSETISFIAPFHICVNSQRFAIANKGISMAIDQAVNI